MSVDGYTGGGLLHQLVDLGIQNIIILLFAVIAFGFVLYIYLKGQIIGQKQGFAEGIKHHIHMEAYDDAHHPATYDKDKYVLKAYDKLETGLKPKIPADIQDDA